MKLELSEETKDININYEELFQSDSVIKNFYKEEDSSLDCMF